jgi:hypothetical protein
MLIAIDNSCFGHLGAVTTSISEKSTNQQSPPNSISGREFGTRDFFSRGQPQRGKFVALPAQEKWQLATDVQ